MPLTEQTVSFDTETLRKATAIAHGVREWAEDHARALVEADDDWGFAPETLDCMCAYASTVLLGCLHAAGLTAATLVGNNDHYHVRLGPYAIDITATQFSDCFAKVEVELPSRLANRYRTSQSLWFARRQFESVEAAFAGLNPEHRFGFPASQYFRAARDMRSAIRHAQAHLAAADTAAVCA